MKRGLKGLGIAALYLLLAGILLGKDIRQLFEPELVIMLFCGGAILSLPHLQKGVKWQQMKGIFGQSALMAGYLESGMLIFVRLHQYDWAKGRLWNDLILDLRPVIYGFACYLICWKKEDLKQQESTEQGTEHLVRTPEKLQTQKDKEERDLSVLTKRERQIAELIKRGFSNREIGEELYISEATVKKHISHIFEKLGIESRRDLM